MNAFDRSRFFLDVATGILHRGYGIRLRVEGSSMMPTIRPGEAVIVKPATATNVKLKDIVFYQTERGVIGHRLVRITNRNGKLVLLARGDADKGASEPVAPAQILGRLVAVERNGRCIDLAGRKAKVKHSIRIHASQCKQQILLLLIARRANWRSVFGPIGRNAAG
jgi:signal peptidase I